jgi:hypothetical protein
MAGRQSILLVESYVCFAVGFDADAHVCRLPGFGACFEALCARVCSTTSVN